MVRPLRLCRLLFSSLLLAALAVPVQAQTKPVAMLSISSVDGLLSNISYLTEAAGAPDMGQMVGMMSNAYLQGIDRANPIGIVLSTDGEQEFTPLAFVPVKDMDAVFSAMEDSFGAPRDLGNGIKELSSFQSVFIKEQNGVAFVAPAIESLAKLPEKPVTQLGSMPQDYDIAIRGLVQNVPKQYIDMAINALKDGVRQGLDNLPEDQRTAQQEMIQAQMAQMETYIKESDQITIGWKTEPANKRTYLDMKFTAVPDSSLAKQMNAMANATSDFTGFLREDAAAQLSLSSPIPQEQIATSVDALQGLKTAAMKEIEKDDDLPSDEARAAAKELAGMAIDLFIETIRSGKMDGCMSVVLKPGDISLLGGFHVADGKGVERLLRRAAQLAEQDSDFPGVKFNAEQSNGVSFHTMSVPVPEEKDARAILGDTLELAVGTGEDAAYIGVGRNCVAQLKNIIASQPKAKSVQPFKLTLALKPIMEFAASIDGNPLVSTVSESLAESGDKTHVQLHGMSIENGFVYRIEIEEGVIRAIGEAIQMANAGNF